MTKISLVILGKLHAILVANNKMYWIERKNQQIQVHLLISLYTYCHMKLRCNYFGHNLKANDVLPHVPIFNLSKI